MKLVNRFFLVLKLEIKSLKTPFCGFQYAYKKWISVISNKGKIQFLGKDFYYEDRLNPFTLFEYINEILYLKKLFKLKEPKKVLDIGANIGIWGYVFLKFFPKAYLYSFEPNSIPFKFLKKNSSSEKNWKIFNFGIGPTEEVRDFYYIDGKSGQGSIYKENAGLNLLYKAKLNECKINLKPLSNSFITNELENSYFDLVKIDTEGAEALVIDALKNITWNYMYVEISINRFGSQSLDTFFMKIKKYWPNAKIINFKSKDEIGDLFLECI